MPREVDTARDAARLILADTAERHGFVILDAEEVENLRLERLTLIAALEVLAADFVTDADRAKARALLAELAEADADA